MKIIIDATPKEIAAFLLEIQIQKTSLDIKHDASNSNTTNQSRRDLIKLTLPPKD